MIFGINKRVNKWLEKFETPTISRTKLKEFLYDNYQPFFIWGKTEKENKTLSRVEAYSIFGPGGLAMSGARYWTDRYVKGGYIILYNVDKGGFRTYPINKITKIEVDSVVYKVS
jgi:hypothetical protein